MFFLSDHADPFGGKDGQRTDMFQEIEGANPEDQTKLRKGKNSGFRQFLSDVGEVFEEVVGGVEVGESLFIDVASSPLIIHQSNSIIEDGSDFLNLRLALSQKFYSPIDNGL